MAITFNCTCGQQLQVDDEYAGAQAQCPDCNKVLTVPSPSASAAAALPVAKRPVVDRPSKRREPVETDDDLGADADTLDPFAARRKSKRKRDDDGDPRDNDEEDRPLKRSKRLAEEDDDDYQDRPRKKKRKRREEPKYNIFNNQTIGGAVLMAIPVVIELVLIIFFNSWFINVWMVIMFVAGLIALIKGLVTGRGE